MGRVGCDNCWIEEGRGREREGEGTEADGQWTERMSEQRVQERMRKNGKRLIKASE